MKLWVLLLMLGAVWQGTKATPEERPRLREFGLKPGVLTPGPLNAITDVAGSRWAIRPHPGTRTSEPE